jgi:hypothetical protein
MKKFDMTKYISENTISSGMHMINEAKKNDSFFFYDSSKSLKSIEDFLKKKSPGTQYTKKQKYGEDAVIFSYEEFLSNYINTDKMSIINANKPAAWKDVSDLRKKIEKTDTSMDIGFSTDSKNPSGE